MENAKRPTGKDSVNGTTAGLACWDGGKDEPGRVGVINVRKLEIKKTSRRP